MNQRLLYFGVTLCFFIFFLQAASVLAGNPFIAQAQKQLEQSKQNQEQAMNCDLKAQTNMRQIFAYLLPIQRKLHQFLSQTIRECTAEHGIGFKTLLLLGTAFLYGLVHALGPGHGKSVASAYFLARGGKWYHGLLMGMCTASVHALSAMITVFVLRFILEGSLGHGLEKTVRLISMISFLSIACIGLFMLICTVREKWKPQTKKANHQGGLIKMAVISGIIPCPGASIILLFALAVNALQAGVFAVLAMSLGMGITISAAGTASLYVRKTSLGLFQKQHWKGLVWGAELFGAFLVCILGLLFAWAEYAG